MGRTHKQDVDRSSIEQLAATLESKIGGDDLERAEDEDGALAERRPRPANEAGVQRLPPILVAHADPAARSAAVAALERYFQVLEAADGEEAWEALSARRDITLLLTGTALPRLDGIDLIRRLRRPGGPPHLVGLPVMVYAEQADRAQKQTALLAGANDYLTSDTEPDALLARVQARNRLFEQSRRAMSLTGTMPTARAGRAEAFSDEGAMPVRTEPDDSRAPGVDRPIWVEARGAADRAVLTPPRRWADRLYRIGSTTTITLTATVLVILGIALILFLNQMAQRPQSIAVGRLDAGAPRAVRPEVEEPKQAPAEPANRVEERAAPPTRTDATRENRASVVPAPKDEPSATPAPAPGKDEPGGTEAAGVSGTKTERRPPVEPRRGAGREGRRQAARSAGESTASRSTTETPPPAVAVAPNEGESSIAPAREAGPAAKAEETNPVVQERRPTAGVVEPGRPGEDTARVEAPEKEIAQPPLAVPDEGAGTHAPAAAAPPLASSPPPRPVRLSRDELSTLLQRFVSVYEAGDIEQFMALLSDDVRTNDRVSRQAVREDYARLFRATDLRQMRIEDMSWDVGSERAQGWGEFEVRVRRRGDATVHHYQGSITVQVRKEGDRPRIERLYHSERRASR